MSWRSTQACGAPEKSQFVPPLQQDSPLCARWAQAQCSRSRTLRQRAGAAPGARGAHGQAVQRGDARALLAGAALTPVDLFYVRNHLPVPHIDAATHSVRPCCDPG